MEKKRSIASIKLDGKAIYDIDAASELYISSSLCEVETLPYDQVFKNALHFQLSQISDLEESAETLITDILLAEPDEIIEKWQSICKMVKAQIVFLPQLAVLLSEDQINDLVEKHLAELDKIMKEAAGSFSTADVVAVSDILELQFLPWLKNFKTFMQNMVELSKQLPQ